MSDPDMVVESVADEEGLAIIANLARHIWQAHYPSLISRAQIDYMLLQGYSLPTMRAEIADGIRYDLARLDGVAAGFASHEATAGTLWLHKLYVLADQRRRGVARALLQTAQVHAREADCGQIRLRVNRGNRLALTAYRRLGFVIETNDIKEIGNGFVMDDYIMRTRVAAQVSANG